MDLTLNEDQRGFRALARERGVVDQIEFTGKLQNGAPVFNVALPLLKKRAPNELPVKFIELDPEGSGAAADAYEGMERRRGATAGANGAH